VNFIRNGHRGYLEDRRPNSEADPCQIVAPIAETMNAVELPELQAA
jgi:glutamine synthetase